MCELQFNICSLLILFYDGYIFFSKYFTLLHGSVINFVLEINSFLVQYSKIVLHVSQEIFNSIILFLNDYKMLLLTILLSLLNSY